MTTPHIEPSDASALTALLAVAQDKNAIVIVPAELLARLQTPAPAPFVERRQADRRHASTPATPAISHERMATMSALASVTPPAVVAKPTRQWAGRKRKVRGRAQRRARYFSVLRSNADLSKLELSDRRRQVFGYIHEAGDEGITTRELKARMAKDEKMADPQDAHGTVTQVLSWLKASAPKPLLKVTEDATEDEAPIGEVVKAKPTRKRAKRRNRRSVH